MALELSSYKAKLRSKGTEIIFCSKAAFSLCTDEIKRSLKILGGADGSFGRWGIWLGFWGGIFFSTFQEEQP